MEISIFSSDSDLEGLTQLYDWGTDRETESRASSRLLRRVNYMQTLEDVDFTFRFRLSKSACQLLLVKLIPYIGVTSTRFTFTAPLTGANFVNCSNYCTMVKHFCSNTEELLSENKRRTLACHHAMY